MTRALTQRQAHYWWSSVLVETQASRACDMSEPAKIAAPAMPVRAWLVRPACYEYRERTARAPSSRPHISDQVTLTAATKLSCSPPLGPVRPRWRMTAVSPLRLRSPADTAIRSECRLSRLLSTCSATH